MLISLVSVPLILHALGESDFGLYNLMAGMIAMLAFLQSSIAVATQRYISVTLGENDLNKLKSIFTVGVIINVLLGIFLFFILELFYPLVFHGWLDIDTERIDAAKIVYQCFVVTTFFNILATPYIAIMNAKENMLIFSIICIIESLLRLFLAIWLAYCPFDRLITYSVCMMLISMISFLLYYFYDTCKYKEFQFSIQKYYNKAIFSQMFGFAGWNSLGALAILGRNQGISVIINLFFSTIGNAAYGIANQVNGIINYFSSSLQKAINPQLMQSFGMNNAQRLQVIIEKNTKYSLLLVSFISIPLIIEMPYILHLWLTTPPKGVIMLTQLILCLAILSQLSLGLMSYIQAIGKVKIYFMIISILLLCNLPISYILFRNGFAIHYCIISFMLTEVISFVFRLVYAKKIGGLNIASFIRQGIIPCILPSIIAGTFAIIVHYAWQESITRTLIVGLCFCFLFLIVTWYLSITEEEKEYIRSTVRLKINK